MDFRDAQTKYDEAKKTLEESKAARRALARAADLKKARESLKKYSADKTFKLIDSNRDAGWSWHKFEGPEENLPREIRRPIVIIRLYDGTTEYEWQKSSVSTSYRRTQKFFCVNGPNRGKWRLLEGQPGYMVFNAASGGNRKFGGKHVNGPSAVLVHIPSIKEPK